MKKILVDTDVIIDFLRTNKGLFLNLLELQEQGSLTLYISSVTVMELFVGTSSQKPDQSQQLKELIDSLRVVPLDARLAQFTGELKRGKKWTILTSDLIVSATALWLKAQLATRNQKHFAGIPGLKFFKIPIHNSPRPR